MPLLQITNNFNTTLVNDITASSTELILTTVAGHAEHKIPEDYSMLTITSLTGEREIVKVTAWSDIDNKATVERAQEGTVALAFAAGSKVGCRFTAGSMETYLESWHTRETANINRVDNTHFTVVGDKINSYKVNRSLRVFGDTIDDLYVKSSVYSDPFTTVETYTNLPTNIKIVELGPDVDWMPQQTNVHHADNADLATRALAADSATTATTATNANSSLDSDKLGGELPSHYAEQSDLTTLTGRVASVESIANAAMPKGGGVFTGNITMPATSVIAALDASTGGLLRLGLGSSQTSEISAAVDVTTTGGNVLRVNEAAGNTRGFYVPISECGFGASSKLALLNGSGEPTNFNIASLFTQNKALHGYMKLPNGMYIQWSNTTTNSTTNVTFPVAFPTACLVVVHCPKNTTTAFNGTTHEATNFRTNTGTRILGYSATGASVVSIPCCYVAIGY